jgi:hypothetical protein
MERGIPGVEGLCVPRCVWHVRIRGERMNKAGLILMSLMWGANGQAHGGGLDASGCHHNRKTGDYHCHRSPQTPPPARRQSLATSNDTYFPNCTAARAAGAAPIRAGTSGYGRHLDRDGDGIACE